MRTWGRISLSLQCTRSGTFEVLCCRVCLFNKLFKMLLLELVSVHRGVWKQNSPSYSLEEEVAVASNCQELHVGAGPAVVQLPPPVRCRHFLNM